MRRRSTELCVLHQEGAKPSLPLMVIVSNQYRMWISPSRVIFKQTKKIHCVIQKHPVAATDNIYRDPGTFLVLQMKSTLLDRTREI